MYSELALDGGPTIWRSIGSHGAIIAADGCADLILRDEEVFVAGPSTCWIETRADGDDGALGLRFSPGRAKTTLALDLSEISDQLVPLSDLVGREATIQARELLLRARETWPAAPDLVAVLCATAGQARPWTSLVSFHARRGTPSWKVAQLLDWSPRTFRRRMLADFGYPYLTLVRIDRAKRAQAYMRDGASPIEAAARAGYADQPHLSREFRRLVGASPGQFSTSAA